jgi:hypothetical protein
MNQLQNQAYQALCKEQYKQSINLYQECIGAFSEDRKNYWLLGLTLLLDEQEEDADNVWLSVILQATSEEMKIWWHELRELLINEAKRAHAAVVGGL